jgi:hypothetical protein
MRQAMNSEPGHCNDIWPSRSSILCL